MKQMIIRTLDKKKLEILEKIKLAETDEINIKVKIELLTFFMKLKKKYSLDIEDIHEINTNIEEFIKKHL